MLRSEIKKEEMLGMFDSWYLNEYGPEPTSGRAEEPNSKPVYGPGGDMLDPDEAFEQLEQQSHLRVDHCNCLNCFKAVATPF